MPLLHQLGLVAIVALFAFASPALAQNVDGDGDGLIDISTLEELNNIRHNLAGTSYKTTDTGAGDMSGCPTAAAPYDPDNDVETDNNITACYGYELTADLDFDTHPDSVIDENDAFWNGGRGWEPIGTDDARFSATFEGNGHTISNLFIKRGDANGVGLFGYFEKGTIANLGLVNVDVTGHVSVGGLAGENINNASITASYASGTVSGGSNTVGGLVGRNAGSITASYAVGTVSGGSNTFGGLVGFNSAGGSIVASYAVGTVSGKSFSVGGLAGTNHGSITASYAVGVVSAAFRVGGLAGDGRGSITASYFDSVIAGSSGLSDAADRGRTTADLQTPTDYTGIYSGWNRDIDGNNTADTPWHFGDSMQYPGLALPAVGGACPMAPALDVSITLRGDAVPHLVDLSISRDANTNRCIHRVRLALPEYVDHDRNGLIEIGTLEELNNIRHDLAGTSYKTTGTGAGDTNGCPTADAPYDPDNDPMTDNNITACYGYELTADLDFDTNPDSVIDENDAFWNGGRGWEPLGTASTTFTATFEGNGHTISNLFISRGETNDVGLFGVSSGNAIRNLGLLNVNVAGRNNVGSLVGWKIGASTITASYAVGTVSGSVNVGGLVGLNGGAGSIVASYALGTVSGDEGVGGLVGSNDSSITASYALGTVSGDEGVGGLVGSNDSSITASYALGTVSGRNSIGGLVGRSVGSVDVSYFDSDISKRSGDHSRMTIDLQTPTMITTATNLYSGWNVDIDNDGMPDNPWHFGDSMQYPGLALSVADAPCFEATHYFGLGADTSAWLVQNSELVDNLCIHRPVYVTIQDFGLTADDDSGTSSTDRITRATTVNLSGKVVPANSTVRITALTVTADDLTVPGREIGAGGVFETAMQVMLEEGSNQFSGYVTVAGFAGELGPIGLPEIIRDTQPPDMIFAKTTPSANCASAAGCAVTIQGVDNTGTAVTIRYVNNFSGGTAACAAITYTEVVADTDMTAYPIYDSATSAPIAIAENTPQCFIATDQTGNLFSVFSDDIASVTVDGDNDGLIDISTLEQLNNMRHNLAGTSYKTTDTGAGDSSGCPTAEAPYDPDNDVETDNNITACYGYELMADLDFDTNKDGTIDSNDAFWNGGSGWEPIGAAAPSTPFTATFEGNDHTISNLFIDRRGTGFIGLFGRIRNGTIGNLGLVDVNVTGGGNTGGLVGEIFRHSAIVASYVAGAVSGGGGVGGLAGSAGSDASIIASSVVGTVSGNNEVGGLAGVFIGGVGAITASYMLGTVSATHAPVGGLVGALTGAIFASYAVAAVSGARAGTPGRGSDGVGGLVGALLVGGITASYAFGTVSGVSQTGGLVGENVLLGSTVASYAVVTVSGNDDAGVGGLVGSNIRSITASYFDSDIAELTEAGRGTTTMVLQTPTTYTGIYEAWNVDVNDDSTADSPWHFGTMEQYPGLVLPAVNGACPVVPAFDVFITLAGADAPHAAVLNIDKDENTNRCIHRVRLDPPNPEHADYDRDGLIGIGTLEELNNIRHNLAGDSYKTSNDDSGDASGCPSTGCLGYELMSDLDFDTNLDGVIDEDDAFWNAGAGWEPIGKDIGSPFTGAFEGNGHTISNLFIYRLNSDEDRYVGLFGLSSGNTIRNLGLLNVNVTGSRDVGSLVGQHEGGGLSAVYAVGTVSGSSGVGGLAGTGTGSITASYAVVQVMASDGSVGGLVGNGNNITASYVIGAVSGLGNFGRTGGLMGSIADGGRITASYAFGTVSGNNGVGGLVGSSFGGFTIVSSYAVGAISGSGSGVGGLFGVQDDVGEETIITSYAVGTVSGSSNVGGLVGEDVATITASYFDSDVAGLSEPSDADRGRMTTELQTPTTITDNNLYSGWNVDIDNDGAADNPWHFGSSMQYPGLALGAADAPCSGIPEGVLGLGADLSAYLAQSSEVVDGQCIHRPVYVTIQDFGPTAAGDSGTYSTDRITRATTVNLRGKVVPTTGIVAVRITALTVTADDLTVPDGDIGTDGVFETAMQVMLEEGSNQFSGYVTVANVAGEVGPIGLPEIIRDTQLPQLEFDKTMPSANCASAAGCAVTIVGTDNTETTVTIRYVNNLPVDAVACPALTYSEVVADLTAYPIYDPATSDPISIAENMPQCFIATDQAGNLDSEFSGALAFAVRVRLRILLEGALQ